ncbi:MAG TPA: hypothetical protein ENH48_00010 [Halieaceae bacterium]|nr:hypothetical protein [Halieaceae bacterium]
MSENRKLTLAGIGCGGRTETYMGLVLALYEEMTRSDPSQMRTSISSSVQSHAMGFAAEESRLTGKVVNLPQFIDRHR